VDRAGTLWWRLALAVAIAVVALAATASLLAWSAAAPLRRPGAR